jgi:hypothetical protein
MNHDLAEKERRQEGYQDVSLGDPPTNAPV